MDRKKIGLVLGPILYILIFLLVDAQLPPPDGVDPDPKLLYLAGRATLACALWMAVWWVTEAVPLAVTALLPIFLFPLSGAVTTDQATAPYASQIIFLFVGGFMLAIAIEKWNLHKRVALGIIAKIGGNPKSIILGFMVASAFLSMWISNTATTIMMVPIGIALVGQLAEENKNTPEIEKFAKALLLGVAYAASIGGIATLIGTPTNAIFAEEAYNQYGRDISFVGWFLFALPVSLVLLAICWWYLVNIGFKFKDGLEGMDELQAHIKDYQKQLGPMSREEKHIIIVFGLVVMAWMLRTVVVGNFFPELKAYIKDSSFAVAGAIALFIIPSKRDKGSPILDWATAVKIPWGVLLLFGGGLSLAKAFKLSGLASWIGFKIGLLGTLPLILMLLFLIAAVNFLTEITSNMATVSMILPILATLAAGIDIHPYILMIGATCAASCAFMLPVATAPNAIVFGSHYINIGDMMRAGVWLNIISIIIFTLYVYYLMPIMWGIDAGSFPQEFLVKPE